MRARAREINIFNMSLLDILCGALGAFCFMMLVLLPYYKPPGSAADLRKEQADTDELLKQLESLKNAAKDSGLAQQMDDLIRKLQDQIKQLQGEVNQYAAQNEQLKTENADLTKKNQEQADELSMRQPFIAIAGTFPPLDVDLYLDSDAFAPGKKLNPPLDLSRPHQPIAWLGDIQYPWGDHAVNVLMKRDSPPGSHYKVYVKLAAGSAARVACKVLTSVVSYETTLTLPSVVLTPDRFAALVGTVTVEGEGKMSFKEATDQERQADWAKLSKDLPPPTPTSSPSVLPTATPLSPEARKKMGEERERNRRLREQQQQAREQQRQRTMPSPSPSLSP
ncbi:MAG: hypothetical protein QOI34_1250 [Verrucomicrobiota bacterium]